MSLPWDVQILPNFIKKDVQRWVWAQKTRRFSLAPSSSFVLPKFYR